MGGLLAARYDSAIVFVSGGGGAALLYRCAGSEGRHAAGDDVACFETVVDPHFSGYFPAVDACPADVFHLRGYADADRSGVFFPVFAGFSVVKSAVGSAGGAAGGVFFGICIVSRWFRLRSTSGFAAHWNKNTNLAWAFDRWFLNLFPRESPFLFNDGGYATLSFIPTLGTMILGLIAGQALKTGSAAREKIRRFLIWGALLVVAGWLLGALGICPVVKRIWTPSWTLFSGGLCCFFLAFFYWTADVLRGQKWYFWLVVIGANSIAAYVMAHTIDGFIASSLRIHLGQNYALCLGEAYAPLVQGTLILLFEWLILWWMYRKRIFIKI